MNMIKALLFLLAVFTMGCTMIISLYTLFFVDLLAMDVLDRAFIFITLFSGWIVSYIYMQMYMDDVTGYRKK